MKQVILYIAMSLDGFIADRNGGVAWLEGHDPDSGEEGSYPKFIKGIDTVIMGYTTYHQVAFDLSFESWPYEGMNTYVLTHRKEESKEEIFFVNEDVCGLVERLKAREGKNIWICGGADVANQLIREDLVDRYHVTVVPCVLGGGVRLFGEDGGRKRLRLISTEHYNGYVDLVYERMNRN